jgi:2-dehydro-3-deoxyphosphogluconate aldolase/(4S)-4-hydroxy-2-oxoglutarate aldolase
VLNVDTAKRAVDAGAKFMVTPGFNPKVVGWCVSNNVAIAPGTSTPTDLEMAVDHGLEVVKYFPAEPMGGVKTIKMVAAPFGMLRFIPTGGIDATKVEEYLKFDKVIAVGGSWMVGKELLAAKQWGKVTELAKQAVEIARRSRSVG